MKTAPAKLGSAAAITLAFVLNIASPAAMAGDSTPAVPDASVLLKFYPARLASTPSGVVEDQQVWLAKVQGLMLGAPPMLQQSLLMSRTPDEFAANIALLQQMQERTLQQSAARLESQARNGALKKQ